MEQEFNYDNLNKEERSKHILKSYGLDIEKAKYIKREPDGKGGYKYIYEESKNEKVPSLETFKNIAQKVNSVDEFKEEVSKIKNVPSNVSKEFFDKYGDGGKIGIDAAVINFLNKHGKKSKQPQSSKTKKEENKPQVGSDNDAVNWLKEKTKGGSTRSLNIYGSNAYDIIKLVEAGTNSNTLNMVRKWNNSRLNGAQKALSRIKEERKNNKI